MGWVLGAVGFLVVLALVTWVAHRMLLSGEGGGAGASDAFGALIDVFDPGKARADDLLRAEKHRGEVTPTPDQDDRPVRIVPGRDGAPPTVRVRRTP